MTLNCYNRSIDGRILGVKILYILMVDDGSIYTYTDKYSQIKMKLKNIFTFKTILYSSV